MPRIFPSLISANILDLRTTIDKLQPHCAGFHLDIMDNHFVPNLTWGYAIVETIARASTKPVWVHLMVEKQHEWLTKLTLPAGTIMSIHYESDGDMPTLINTIKEKKWLASIAIKPDTPITAIEPLLGTIDQILIMSVEPGFSGQSFIDATQKKIAPLVALRTQHNYTFAIGMDGGITQQNIGTLAAHGVDDLAIASALFDAPDPVAALQALHQQIGTQ